MKQNVAVTFSIQLYFPFAPQPLRTFVAFDKKALPEKGSGYFYTYFFRMPETKDGNYGRGQERSQAERESCKRVLRALASFIAHTPLTECRERVPGGRGQEEGKWDLRTWHGMACSTDRGSYLCVRQMG